MKQLRLIGYWRNAAHPECPDPQELVDSSWDEDKRQAVVVYLASGTFSRHYMGLSSCRICGQSNGASEFTDGTYAWPEGLGHYVEAHSVRLPEEFAGHVVARLEALEAAEHDLGWWLANTA